MKLQQFFLLEFLRLVFLFTRHRHLGAVRTFKYRVVHLQSEVCAEDRTEFVAELLLLCLFLLRQPHRFLLLIKLVDAIYSLTHDILR